MAVSVFDGNVCESPTLLPQVRRPQDDFHVRRVVLVGDRGMIGRCAIDALGQMDGVQRITALKSVQIRALVEGGRFRGFEATRARVL